MPYPSAKSLLIAIALFTLQNGHSAAPSEDPLGVTLPKDVDPMALVKMLAPQTNPSLTTLVGMKKWPHRKNSYIAIVCSDPKGKPDEISKDFKKGRRWCETGYGGFYTPARPEVYLGIVEQGKDLKLIAKSDGPLRVATTDVRSNIKLPGRNEGDGLYPGAYRKFDFAKYKVSDSRIAFGLRVYWEVSLAGGGAEYTGLMLFLEEDGKIRNIFSEPVEESGISGSGPESKSSWETLNVLRILPRKTAGYSDIELKEKGGSWNQWFSWDADARRYLPLVEEGEGAGDPQE